ncbi:MAG: PAS domain S-box protein [Methanosarcina sp.]
MRESLRKSGIDIIGDVQWGTHFCQFYQTKEDLIDILVPYFKAGLENNELCVWITSKPLEVEEAKEAIKRAVPDIDVYLEKGQIEIIPYTHGYLKEGIFDPQRVVNDWVEKINQALARGYDGLRASGDNRWLEKEGWNGFVDYENKVDAVVGKHHVIALCPYYLDMCSTAEIVDVISNHQFALIKREGKWERIENSGRRRAEKEAIQAAKNWEYTFDAVPDLIAITDDKDRIIRANRAMAARLGITPEECAELACYRVIHGTDKPPSFCLHQQLLKDRAKHTTEICEDCLGGNFLVSTSPLYDSEEKLTGSVYVARDIAKRKQEEHRIRRYNRILEGINRILSNVVQAKTEEELGEACLSVALEITGSEFGFIIEMGADGLLHDVAKSELAWEQCRMYDKTGHVRLPSNYVVHGLYGSVVINGKSFFTNEPQSHPDSVDLPDGHPPIKSFLGVPLIQDGKAIGSIAVANREGGYRYEQQEDLEAIAPAMVQALQRKKAEQERRQAEEKFAKAFYGNAADMVITRAKDGIIIDANDRWLRATGYSRDEVIGRSINDDLHIWADLEKRNEMVRDLRKFGSIRGLEMEFINKNGTRRVALLFLQRMVLDGKVAILSSSLDITKQKEAEEALRKSEKRFRSLIEQAPVAIAIDRHGLIDYANPQYLEMFRIDSLDDIRGRPFLEVFAPQERMRAKEGWRRIQLGLPEPLENEFVGMRRDGTQFPFCVAVSRIELGGESVNIVFLTDITERKQAEHQLSNELARATGLYELYTRSSNLSDRELYDFALNQAVKITDSTIGFFHLVSEDEKEIILTTWNQEALRSCTAGNEGHYPIEKAGNWVDCVRLKRPVVYNDFPSSPNQKGLPAGHAAVKRFMSVPVTENGKVRIIFGVGNKVDEYDDRDVVQLQLVANELHKIMKLRRIENEVRESEAFLRDIMENVSDAIFVKDREARMILANTAYYRLMGKSPEEVLNKTAADFHLPEIARKLAEDDKRVMETGKGTTLEERIFTSHGWRILQTVKAPYYDGQGNIIGLIGAARDITERKKAEEALKKAHGNLEKLVEERTAELEKAYNSLKESEIGLAEAQKMAHIGNWDWNLVNGGGYWSNELYHIFGRSPQKSAPFYDELFNYIHPDDREYVEKSIQNGLKEGPKSGIDYRIVLANGEERTVHSQAEVIFDEQKIPVRVKGIVQDITERKRIEAELELVARLPQENPDPVMRLNQGRIINYANPSAQVLLTDWGSAISKEAPREITELSVAALGDGIRRKLECTYANRIYMIDIAPFPGAGYVNLYAHDITESKKAKEALEKIDKIRIKEIHHRIKNNLQVISSLLDLQAEKFRNKEVLEAFRESQNRVTSMSLIHEELYKGEGNDTLNFSAYLQKLVESLFQTYSLSSKNVRLCMDLEENTLFNMDVAVPLGIIVNELVSNSLKHAFAENKEGEVRIKLRREEKGNEMHKSFFSLSISDNGKGIPESIKLESLESLGLQLVNILVDQLDGKTELKRTHGTEFRITFNVAERS